MNLVPTQRLMGLVGGVVLLAALAGPFPELAPAWILGLCAVLLLALADVARTLAADRTPSVTAPPVIRLTRDRVSSLEIRLSARADRPETIRFALGLPGGFTSEEEVRTVVLAAGAEAAALIPWRCTAGRRGRFSGALACIETASWLGLWSLRVRLPLRSEFRVYPNLFAESRQLAALMLARGRLGRHVHRVVGRGREFEKLRDYLPGDGVDEIHWKATAKRGRPVTKVFQVERTQEIYVILDGSRLSGRVVESKGGAQTVLERYLASALILMKAAGQEGDRFGLVTYDDRVRLFIRAGQGAAHYAACLEAAVSLEPSGHTPDMPEIVRHLTTQLRRRALLIFLTDLTDPVLAEDFTRNIRVLSRRHLILVCQLRPSEVAPLFSGTEVDSDEEIYGRLAGHARWMELQSLFRMLKAQGIGVLGLEQETMAAQLVNRYLDVKRRQML